MVCIFVNTYTYTNIYILHVYVVCTYKDTSDNVCVYLHIKVDPQTASFDPSPLIPYVEALYIYTYIFIYIYIYVYIHIYIYTYI
jgi:hypothetical protein